MAKVSSVTPAPQISTSVVVQLLIRLHYVYYAIKSGALRWRLRKIKMQDTIFPSK